MTPPDATGGKAALTSSRWAQHLSKKDDAAPSATSRAPLVRDTYVPNHRGIAPDRQSDDSPTREERRRSDTLTPPKDHDFLGHSADPCGLLFGIKLAGGASVSRSAQLDDVELVRLPRPPRPARVDLVPPEHPESEILPIVAKSTHRPPAVAPSLLPALAMAHRPEPAPKRPSLEWLLRHAETLAQSMAISDPRGRLLQIALLRRDHTLLDAVVRSADKAYGRQSSATWRPMAKRVTTKRSVLPPAFPHRRRTTERPVATPRRGR